MKKWFYFPSFLSKQGLLFEAKKAFLFPRSDYPFPIKAFVKVNLFKINSFTKNIRTGKKENYGTTMKSWYIANHAIELDNPGIHIYYDSLATCSKKFKKFFQPKKKIKQLRLELN